MNTRLLAPTDGNLDLAAQALQAGELVAFPTETVYGLGANALDPEAVQKVFTAKGRPADHPLIVHLADMAQVRQWTSAGPATWDTVRLLASGFWPGPLTLVLPRSRLAHDLITGGQDTVALRMPAHGVARELLLRSGLALVAPSANRFGRISPTTARHVLQELSGRIPLVLDGGPSQVGLESTILDLSGPTPRILRPGMVSAADLAKAADVEVAQAGDTGVPRVSGSLASHYAPVTTTRLVGDGQLSAAVQAAGTGLGVIARQPAPASFKGHWLELPADPAGYGQAIYAALRQLDGQVTVILVQEPPAGTAWVAVRDRLARASAGHAPTVEGQDEQV